MTPAEIEMMIAENATDQSVPLHRDNDGILRVYYAGFNLTSLAEHISRELANTDEQTDETYRSKNIGPQPGEG